ncbi:MAG: glycosyltransferase [Candidatus Hydrothermarchaeota archaeon]
MRVAIFHDYIGSIGGGEKLILSLARALDATVITTDVNERSLENMGFGGLRVSSLGETWKVAPFKQVSASLMFYRCDFSSEYDFFIFSGNWAHYASRHHRPNLWYCHTPVRAFYDLRDYVIRNQKTPIHRLVARGWIAVHSLVDRRSVSRIDGIVANSANTQERIRRYYGRESTVVYPPVPTASFRYKKNGDFWLSVNRLYPEKRVPLQIEAFRRLPHERLKIVGWYSKGDHAERSLGYLNSLPPNVELLGEVKEEELQGLYAECRAFITTSMDEDFGMTAIEAMAAGKPVVAVDEGGYRESVIDGVTGRLVGPTVEAITAAIEEVSREPGRYREACEKRARAFDVSIFIERMKEEIETIALQRS